MAAFALPSRRRGLPTAVSALLAARHVPGSSCGAALEFRWLRSRAAGAWERALLLRAAAAAFALLPCLALAHAIIVAAQPAMNSTVAAGALDIRLNFSSRVDPKRSGLSLRGPGGSEVAVALLADAPPGVLAGHAWVRAGGTWKLHWQVLSLDGHITRGEVVFSVHEPASPR